MHGDDFEDEIDEDGPVRPLLPPEDRIWRHPSELSALDEPSLTRSYVGRTAWAAPTRAGVLAAGLTGALLATGLVLLGTQLLVAVQQQQLASSGHARTTSRTTNQTQPGDLTTHSTDKPTITTLASVKPQSTTQQPAPQQQTVPQLTRQVADMVVKVSAASVRVTAVTPGGELAGTGFVFSGDGYLLTALALVRGATSLSVSAPGLGRRSASVVGADSRTGIAVLRCHCSFLALPYTVGEVEADEAPAGDVRPKDPLWAVVEGKNGASIAYCQVEGVDMALAPIARSGGNAPALVDAIETSYGSNETSLGSTLIDGKGRLVGLAVGSESGSTAVTPLWLAVGAAKEITARGKVEPGWLGISGVDDGSGVRVVGVSPSSSAAAAGLQPGDVITAVDGSPTADMGSLEAHVYCLTPGTTARLTVKRHGRKITDRVTMERAPAA